jgi:hypothetical protein
MDIIHILLLLVHVTLARLIVAAAKLSAAVVAVAVVDVEQQTVFYAIQEQAASEHT